MRWTTRLKITLAFLLTMWLVNTATPRAATITAANCSSSSVQSAINSANSGDTVVIPAGSCSWTSGVSIGGKAVTLRGSGSGRIVGRSTTSLSVGTGARTLTTQSGLGLTSGQIVRVSRTGNRGMFMQGTVTSYSGTTLSLNVTTTGGSGSDALWLISTNPTTVIVSNAGSSSLLYVTEDSSRHTEISGIKIAVGSGTGQGIFIARASSGQAVLIHDCWIEGGPGGDATTAGVMTNSNRGVIWNTSFDASPFAMGPIAFHMKDGPTDSWTTPSTMGNKDTTGSSNFYVEDSDFHAWLNATDFDDNARVVIRHSVFNNAGIGTHGADTSDVGQRHFEVYDSEFVFNGYSNGSTFNLNWWFFLRGGTGVIADNIMPNIQSTDYGDKLEINMIVMNLQRSAGPNPCWGANQAGNQYPAPRQVGMGRVTGNAGNDSVTYKGDSEPLYIWNNTGGYSAGTTDYGGGSCASPDSSSGYVVAGRDFFNNGTAKPGYVKYTYPHPLRGGGAPPTSAPSAPSNVRITQ